MDIGRRVGLVAGWGSFPLQVAAQLRAAGKTVVVAAIRDHASPALQQYADDIKWFGVAKLGGQIRYFQRHRVDSVVLAGKIFKHRVLYHGLGWISHLPDRQCIRTLHKHFISRTKDGRDDSLLSAIVGAFEDGGMRVLRVDQCAPELLASGGYFTKRRMRRTERIDVAFGWRIARQMGGLDIGQSVTVKDQIILGVEAIEGTDALIARTAQLCPRGRFALVKVAKPEQDMRFDVPTIGPRTVEQMIRAGGSVIAIEAGRTIVVDREKTFAMADDAGIAIVAIQEDSGNLFASDEIISLAQGDTRQMASPKKHDRDQHILADRTRMGKSKNAA